MLSCSTVVVGLLGRSSYSRLKYTLYLAIRLVVTSDRRAEMSLKPLPFSNMENGLEFVATPKAEAASFDKIVDCGVTTTSVSSYLA
jgi:hypothetical protein